MSANTDPSRQFVQPQPRPGQRAGLPGPIPQHWPEPPAYRPPVPVMRPRNWAAVTGLVLGLVGLPLALLMPAILFVVTFFFAVVTIVFSAIGLPHKKAVAGLLLGVAMFGCGVWGVYRVETVVDDVGDSLTSYSDCVDGLDVTSSTYLQDLDDCAANS